jgi:hypothetical protein
MRNHPLLHFSTLLATVLLTFAFVVPAHAQPATVLLDDAYATLAQGKHDYKGHRVRAMKQIELALGEAGGKVSGHGRVHESQGTSDAQLHAAQELLAQAGGSVTGKALKHVNLAIDQLKIALSAK